MVGGDHHGPAAAGQQPALAGRATGLAAAPAATVGATPVSSRVSRIRPSSLRRCSSRAVAERLAGVGLRHFAEHRRPGDLGTHQPRSALAGFAATASSASATAWAGGQPQPRPGPLRTRRARPPGPTAPTGVPSERTSSERILWPLGSPQVSPKMASPKVAKAPGTRGQADSSASRALC